MILGDEENATFHNNIVENNNRHFMPLELD